MLGGATGAVPLDAFERRLIDGWQRGFPLVERPYATLAASLGGSEREVLDAVARRLVDGVFARVGAVFRPGAIGASTLAAIAVPPARLDEIAAIVSARSEVNHNYAREHAVNLWFVAAAANAAALERALVAIEAEAGLPVLRLPLERDYAIDLGFRLDGSRDPRAAPRAAASRPVEALVLDASDHRLVAALDEGLAAVPRPWADLAARACTPEARVLVRVAQWLNRGAIARLGLVVRHRPLGWTANAMCVWDVPIAGSDALGAALAAEAGVTLAYRRARANGWPFNLYAMIHGRERAQVVARREAIATKLGLDRHPHAVLFSTRAYLQRGARHAAPVAA